MSSCLRDRRVSPLLLVILIVLLSLGLFLLLLGSHTGDGLHAVDILPLTFVAIFLLDWKHLACAPLRLAEIGPRFAPRTTRSPFSNRPPPRTPVAA